MVQDVQVKGNGARCTNEGKSKIAMAKLAIQNKKTLFTNKIDFNLRNKLTQGTVEHSLV